MNIYQELHDDLGCTIPSHGCLTKWAEQGVLMLKYGSDRAGPSGQLPPGDRLGRIHGCGDHGAQQPGPAHRVHPVGKSRPAQESHAEQSEAPHPDGASSEPRSQRTGDFSAAGRSARRMSSWRVTGSNRSTGRSTEKSTGRSTEKGLAI